MMTIEMKATARDIIGLCFNFPSLADTSKYAAYDALGQTEKGSEPEASR